MAGHLEATSLQSTQQESTPQASPRLGHLSPYKKADQGEPKGREKKKHEASRKKREATIFLLFLFETWGSTPSLACL
jgi:hypothetical protein